MGHTNQTANYNLPQFVGTDKPSWLGDINDAFAAIDTAIAAAASEASTADGKADALGTTVSGHTTQIGTLQNTVTTQGNTLNTVTSLIGNGTPTTTDQTIIGAINELNAKEGDLADLTTTDKSSLVAAINEAAAGGGGLTINKIEITSATRYADLQPHINASIEKGVVPYVKAGTWTLSTGGHTYVFDAVILHYVNGTLTADSTPTNVVAFCTPNADGTAFRSISVTASAAPTYTADSTASNVYFYYAS